MPKQREIRKIFIGSPKDLQAERQFFRDVIEEVNRIKAHGMGIELEAVGWEDTHPGKGRPQEFINKDIEECDLVTLLLWKRWGTDRGKYSSGFEEEYELANSLNEKGDDQPGIMMYFKSVPDEMLSDPGDQLRKVLDFQDKIEKENKFLVHKYETEQQWERKFREHLCLWLDGIKPLAPTLPYMSEHLQKIDTLEKKLQESRSKEGKNALEWAVEAEDHADSGRLTKAEEYYARAIAASNSPHIISSYGLFLFRIGSLNKAEDKFKQLIDICESISDKELTAKGYGNLGLIYQTRGDLDESEKMHKKSLAINEECGHKEGMAKQFGNLALIYQTRGDLDKAEKMLKESLAINEELGRKEGIANQYGNLGLIYQTRGDLDEAEKMYKKSLAINEEFGRKEGIANQYGNLGLIYQIRGDLDEAEKMHKKSLALNEELGRKEGIASQFGNLALIYQTRGDLDEAEKMHKKSLAMNEGCGYKEGMANQYGNLGLLYQIRKDLDEAEKMIKKSLAIDEELGRKEGMAIAFYNLGNIDENKGDIDKAREMFEQSLRFYKEIGAKPGIEDAKARLKALEKPKKKGKKKK